MTSLLVTKMTTTAYPIPLLFLALFTGACAASDFMETEMEAGLEPFYDEQMGIPQPEFADSPPSQYCFKPYARHFGSYVQAPINLSGGNPITSKSWDQQNTGAYTDHPASLTIRGADYTGFVFGTASASSHDNAQYTGWGNSGSGYVSAVAQATIEVNAGGGDSDFPKSRARHTYDEYLWVGIPTILNTHGSSITSITGNASATYEVTDLYQPASPIISGDVDLPGIHAISPGFYRISVTFSANETLPDYNNTTQLFSRVWGDFHWNVYCTLP
jgi:hypothetical protein